jgi:hypothetical protein
MVRTKKNITLAAVLGVALVSLAVDRLFLDSGQTGPDEAGAAQVGEPLEHAEEVPSPVDAATLVDASLGERLEKIRDGHDLDLETPRDAFRASPEWTQAQGMGDIGDGSGDADTGARRHVLTAVMLLDTGNVAIINDTYLRVGQEIDGWRLTQVDRGSAMLEGQGLSVTLRLQGESRSDKE